MTTETTENKLGNEWLSRVGRRPVVIPSGTKVTITGRTVQAEGKRGKLSWDIPENITAKVDGTNVLLAPIKPGPTAKSMHGLARKIVANLVEGVSTGFQKKLSVEGVGFRASVSGNKLNLTLGFSHPVKYDIPQGIAIKPDPKNANLLTIEGNDKQLVGEVAARIRAIKPPEPYKGTGIRYINEIVKRKAGKSAVGAAAGGKK